MLSRFMTLFNGGMRAYKVQDASRDIRVGVTAKSFDDLLTKGKRKLKIPDKEKISVVIEDDGTLVDSDNFLKTLPVQTALVFLREGERWSGAGALVYQALSMLFDSDKKFELAEQIREMMTNDNAPEKVGVMSQYLDMLEVDTESELRYEHEDWFEGLNKKYKSKSEVLRNSAQQRVRSYHVSAKDQIEKEKDPETKALLLKLMEDVYTQLKKNDFHGQYFDRSAAASKRICDKNGWFRCEGPFDRETCAQLHTINPYASRGYRQLFSMWNLDHIIEKSREVIPTLIEAAKKKPKHSSLKCDEVYRLLFTRSNLRLVQVGCHKKAARLHHTVSVESFYIS